MFAYLFVKYLLCFIIMIHNMFAASLYLHTHNYNNWASGSEPT